MSCESQCAAQAITFATFRIIYICINLNHVTKIKAEERWRMPSKSYSLEKNFPL